MPVYNVRLRFDMCDPQQEQIIDEIYSDDIVTLTAKYGGYSG